MRFEVFVEVGSSVVLEHEVLTKSVASIRNSPILVVTVLLKCSSFPERCIWCVCRDSIARLGYLAANALSKVPITFTIKCVVSFVNVPVS